MIVALGTKNCTWWQSYFFYRFSTGGYLLCYPLHIGSFLQVPSPEQSIRIKVKFSGVAAFTFSPLIISRGGRQAEQPAWCWGLALLKCLELVAYLYWGRRKNSVDQRAPRSRNLSSILSCVPLLSSGQYMVTRMLAVINIRSCNLTDACPLRREV